VGWVLIRVLKLERASRGYLGVGNIIVSNPIPGMVEN